MGNLNISRKEFRGFVFNELEGFFKEKEIGKEYAYEEDLGNGIILRILSSVDINEKRVRGEGKDSIKIHLYDSKNDSIISSASSTKRTQGYRKRIKEKINQLSSCPECESDLRAASGEYGRYFFCLDDSCDYTKSLEDLK